MPEVSALFLLIPPLAVVGGAIGGGARPATELELLASDDERDRRCFISSTTLRHVLNA